jgi:hypothetical protein
MIDAFGLVVLLCLASGASGETPITKGWIDQLTDFVLMQRGIEREGSFEPYLGQLSLVRHMLRNNDHQGAYVALNRCKDMLEASEGEIRPSAAETIWDYCYQVTPPAFHDEKRHKRRWGKTVDWEKFFWGE